MTILFPSKRGDTNTSEMNGHCSRHGLNQHGTLHLLQAFPHSAIPSVMVVVLSAQGAVKRGLVNADISHCATILPVLKSREISELCTGQWYFYKTHTGYCSGSRAPTEKVQEHKCCFVTRFKKLLGFPNDWCKFYNYLSSSLEKSVINKMCLSECFIGTIVTTNLQYLLFPNLMKNILQAYGAGHKKY